MVGKLTKIAQGLSVTHAWREEVDRALIAAAAQEVGARRARRPRSAPPKPPASPPNA